MIKQMAAAMHTKLKKKKKERRMMRVCSQKTCPAGMRDPMALPVTAAVRVIAGRRHVHIFDHPEVARRGG